jgi:3'-phosphoadenosine 5'-phosphosulfate sulfotransferase (PAPS reductase)/FAD synthetase
MKRFIAFSGGVESSAMCILYGKNATPVFTDTGFEHKPMLARIEMMEGALKKIHGDEFTILKLRADNVEGTGTSTLPDYIKKRKFYPNPLARFCTRLFKIEPLDEFLSGQGECEVLIGLNADEEDEREGNYGECKNVTYRYPLVDDGLSRADCEALLKQHGLMPKFPSYMRRGGCVGCFFKAKSEYKEMARLAPEEAYMVAELEEAIQDKRGTYYHIHGGIKNMRAFIEAARAQQYFKLDDSQDAAPTGKGCGVFCHR